MKLGILTFHRSINYGAFMQCYSLSNEIRKRYPGIEVEVVDFEKLTKHYMYLPKKKSFVDKLQYNEKRKQYDAFRSDLKHLPLSSKCLITDNYNDVFDYINGQYDILVVGSDAVWAYNQKLGLKNPYWLFGDKLKCHKLSYAASAYSLDQIKMSQEERDYIGSCLSSFDYIGVRDSETRKLVENCLPGATVYMNCDPTVLLPQPDKSEGIEILKKHGVDTNKKIVSVMSRGSEYARVIKNYLGTDNYTYINLYQRERIIDKFNFMSPKFIYDLSPLEWYKIYSCCTLNITTFFHGTLLALKSNVPTISLDVTRLAPDYVSKIQQLLHDLGLSEFWFRNREINKLQRDNILERVDYIINNEHILRIEIENALKNEAIKAESFFAALDNIVNSVNS